MAVLTLVLPNTTTSIAGPIYSSSQLALIAVASLVLYGAFVLVQTVRHRDYFLPEGEAAHDAEEHAALPSRRVAAFSASCSWRAWEPSCCSPRRSRRRSSAGWTRPARPRR